MWNRKKHKVKILNLQNKFPSILQIVGFVIKIF